MNIVYTAISGGYDKLREVQYKTPGWQYICFSDVYRQSETWDVKVMRLIGDKAKWTKKIKILNHIYAPADVSIWIDGNLGVVGDMNEFLAEIPDGNLVIAKHHQIDNFKDEAEACIKNNLDNHDIIRKQISRYGDFEYKHTANTIIVRRGDVIKAMNLWWDEVYKWSKRDQLSFGYAMRHSKQEYQTYDRDICWKYFTFSCHEKVRR